MKQKVARLIGIVAFLTGSYAAPAHASMKEWLNICGSGSFVTCASVRLWVSGTTVTLEVQNLSSGNTANSASGYRGAVFYSIGLRNLPLTVMRSGTFFNESGPTETGKAPAAWAVSGVNGAGQINVSDVATGTPTYLNGIASNCATTAGGTDLTGSTSKLWMTPTCGATNVTNPTLNAGWVDINFMTNQTWDPIAMNTELVINGIDEQGRLYTLDTSSFGTAPEPLVILLLGTGLAAMSGNKLRRKRRIDREQMG